MIKIPLFLLFTIIFISPGYTQTAATEKKVKELLDLTGAGKMGEQVAEQVLTVFQKDSKSVPAEFWDKMKSEIKAEDVVNMVVPVYLKYYSAEEIEQLIAFYKTPLGKKIIAVTPAIIQESMKIGQEWGKGIAEKVVDELYKNGYGKDAPKE
ncbi:MAG: DUF2059 domain-containing protein [Ferruginibacter sp.]